MIINQELNSIKLVCSNEMLPKIEEYKKLANDFVDEFQIVMNGISTTPDETAKQLQTIGHDKRTQKMIELNNEIQQLMRKEIGYFSK